MQTLCNWIIPDWPAPSNVKALTTVRHGGVSLAPFDSFNFGNYVGDSSDAVRENRLQLRVKAGLPHEPFWLKQVHGTRVIDVGAQALPYSVVEADAACAFQENLVCAVTTADCLPLLLCDQKGTCVSAVHAGWRGLAMGVIEAAVLKLNKPAADLIAWLGPAIGPQSFEVREDVLDTFKADISSQTFVKTEQGTWLANLYALARLRLERLGITDIFGGTFCTYQNIDQFYSFRRDKTTGRMATLIWLDFA